MSNTSPQRHLTVTQRYILLGGLLVVAVIAVLFALQQSHLQIVTHLVDSVARSTIFKVGFAASLLLMLVGMFGRYPKESVKFASMLWLMNLCYAALSLYTGSGKLLFHIESMVFAFAMLPLIVTQLGTKGLWRLIGWGGGALLLLNSVTLLYWGEWLYLEHHQVPRIGGALDRPDLEPFFFGWFGMTESVSTHVLGLRFGRLQGWSSEPLHWAYFVFMIISALLVLFASSARYAVRCFYGSALGAIAVYLFFMNSTTVLLTSVLWLLAVGSLVMVRRYWAGRETLVMFILVILTPGLGLPFLFGVLSGIQEAFIGGDILGEGANWTSKLDFLSLGSGLYTRLLPVRGDTIVASHNLVLGSYLKGGYLLVLPLLGVLYILVKTLIVRKPLWLAASSLLMLVVHTITVPTQFFYPSAVVWIFMLYGVSRYTPELVEPVPKADRLAYE